MNKNIKEKFKKGMAYSAILLSVATLGITGGNTYAKYFTKIDGEGNAEIARWSFRANNTSTFMENIQLSNTYNTSVLKNKTIAPGTNGSFDISSIEKGLRSKDYQRLLDLLEDIE